MNTDYEVERRSANWMVPPEWTYDAFVLGLVAAWSYVIALCLWPAAAITATIAPLAPLLFALYYAEDLWSTP